MAFQARNLFKPIMPQSVIQFVLLLISAVMIVWPTLSLASDGDPEDIQKSLRLGDPINARTRSYYFTHATLNLGGPLPLTHSLVFQSQANFESGVKSAIPYMYRTGAGKAYIFRWGDGTGEIMFQDLEVLVNGGAHGDHWEASPHVTYRYALQEVTGAGNWFYLMDPSDQSVYILEKNYESDDSGMQEARLRYRLDRNGNQLTYTYSCWNCRPNTTTISDGLGRQITLFVPNSADSNDNVSTISDGTRTYHLGYNAGGNLSTITNPLDDTITFEYMDAYSPNTLTKKVLPLGNAPYTQTFEGTYDGRVTSQVTAYGDTTAVSVIDDPDPGDPDPVCETRPDGSQVIYTHSSIGGNPLAVADAQGNQASFTVTDDDQLTAITDRLGDTIQISYHEPTGFIKAITNARGHTTTNTYTAQDQTFTNPSTAHQFTFTFYNRTRTDYPDDTFETFEYDAVGNLTRYTDRAGQTTTMAYNSQGLVLTSTNPTGGVTTYTYNDDGTRATSTDSDTDTTSYSYDALKRLIRVDPPGSGQVDITYDALDRITLISDENGHTVQYEYDGNGNLTKVTDAAGQDTQLAYDLMDRVSQVIDPSGGVTAYTYDFMNAPTAVIDPNGIQTRFTYNSRRWLTGITRNGRTQTFTQDAEGVISGTASPAGRNLVQQTDKLGHLTSLTLPGGETTVYERDSRSRITAVTDALDRQTEYSYDNRGALLRITLPGGASVEYTRNALGRLTAIDDLNGQHWEFNYTGMGRMVSSTDPLDRIQTFSHDTRGRVATITHSDGIIETRSYDNADNLTQQQFSDGTVLSYDYDALDHLTGTNALDLTRDVQGRVSQSTYNGHSFGVTYDAGGRIATATYEGAFTVNYSYDADNRLNQVTDTLGHQVDFSYDADGNVTGISRANGLNVTSTYDNNNRLTRTLDGEIIDLEYSYDAVGQLTGMSGTMPLDPADLFIPGTDNFSVDPAGQTSTSGYTYDLRGRATAIPGHTLDWDGNTRLTRLDTASFAYNGLNEIISRTQDGATTHFYHNHGLGLNPIVAEEEAAGFIRYYIYTPGGQLLYSLDPTDGNSVCYYHRDHLGSTLALSDGSGNITDRYAYSPYGKMLGHEGDSGQPFTFVGTLGVRMEGDLYQMRRRYYDPLTASFLSKEPLWPQIWSPLVLNPYQYAVGNPIRHIDPLGLQEVEVNLRPKTLAELKASLIGVMKNDKEVMERGHDPSYSSGGERNADLARAFGGKGKLMKSEVGTRYVCYGIAKAVAKAINKAGIVFNGGKVVAVEVDRAPKFWDSIGISTAHTAVAISYPNSKGTFGKDGKYHYRDTFILDLWKTLNVSKPEFQSCKNWGGITAQSRSQIKTDSMRMDQKAHQSAREIPGKIFSKN